MYSDDRITKKAPRGQHIALRCKNHPNLRWHTKNVGYSIGARSLFFDLYGESREPECNCPLMDLEVVPIDGPDIP